MYVITNRTIDDSKSGTDKFGRKPNPAGPNELRLLKVADNGRTTLLDDVLSRLKVDELIKRYSLDINPDDTWFQSLAVACELFEQAQREKKSILLFVHGYNNDVKDVLKTARELEKTYGVIVVPFTWPANGGGPVSGTAAYLGDKEDARVSSTALHRVVQKIQYYHHALVVGLRERHWRASVARYEDNLERARMVFDRKMRQECHTSISLMCHSMGNYVLKHALLPSHSALRDLAFDNIALVAADVNNPGHDLWLEQLPTRNRLFVVINEDDGALKWSRRKPGEEQLARLGHYLRDLNATNAYYIDVTRMRGVGSAHSYFKPEFVKNNKTLARLFEQIVTGGEAERSLEYHADLNVYRS